MYDFDSSEGFHEVIARAVITECLMSTSHWKGDSFNSPLPLIASSGDAFYHVVSRILVSTLVENGLDIIWTDFSGCYYETDFFSSFPTLSYLKTAPVGLNNSRLRMDRPLVAYAPIQSVRPVNVSPLPEDVRFHKYKSTQSAKDGIRERLVSLHLLVPTLNDSLQILN